MRLGLLLLAMGPAGIAGCLTVTGAEKQVYQYFPINRCAALSLAPGPRAETTSTWYEEGSPNTILVFRRLKRANFAFLFPSPVDQPERPLRQRHRRLHRVLQREAMGNRLVTGKCLKVSLGDFLNRSRGKLVARP